MEINSILEEKYELVKVNFRPCCEESGHGEHVPFFVQSGGMGDTGKWKHQGKKDLGWGGGRGQEAHRSIAGIGRKKNPKAFLRQEASRRPPGEKPTA